MRACVRACVRACIIPADEERGIGRRERGGGRGEEGREEKKRKEKGCVGGPRLMLGRLGPAVFLGGIPGGLSLSLSLPRIG